MTVLNTFISVEEFSKITNTKKDGIYAHIKTMCNNLGSKSIKVFNKENNRYVVYPWFSKLEYYINEGMVEIEFNSNIEPFLLMLKDNFTAYVLKYVIHMKSRYSIRLYELLKQYEIIGLRKIELNKLKELLNIDDKYKLYGHIRQRVLEPAKKEIEKTSDIRFTYQEIKTGRKITAIKFYITKNESSENYSNYDKFKLTCMIQNEFYNKFNINLHHTDFLSKHRIILIDILRTLKGVNQSKIRYPERWFKNAIIESTNKYDSDKICKLKDF